MDEIEDASRTGMLASAARIDEAHARISALQRDLAEQLAQLSATAPGPVRGPLWRAYLRFDREIETVKSGLEHTQDRLVDDARTAPEAPPGSAECAGHAVRPGPGGGTTHRSPDGRVRIFG